MCDADKQIIKVTKGGQGKKALYNSLDEKKAAYKIYWKERYQQQKESLRILGLMKSMIKI